MIGKWSEFRAVWTLYETAVTRWADIRVMSGEEATGRGWVGEGELRMHRSLVSMTAAIVFPRAAALSHEVCECQASLCALKSPSMRVSVSEMRKASRVFSERLWSGQLEHGGIYTL